MLSFVAPPELEADVLAYYRLKLGVYTKGEVDQKISTIALTPGPRGPTGPAGTQGPVGAKGDVGAKGATGAQGTQGAAGVAGPKGVTGADGPRGPTGPSGPTGAQGAQGNQGTPGKDADQAVIQQLADAIAELTMRLVALEGT